MKKKISLLTVTALLASAATALASGYRIPEQSVSSTALSAAHVAHTPGTDASYFNPANMAWLEDRWQLEADFTYINLPSVSYTDSTSAANSGGSRDESFLAPQLFVTSPSFNNFRFGLAVIHPAGLSKRWDATFPRQTAEDFTLKVSEANPTVSYQFCDRFSAAAGIRLLYATGEVRSQRDLGGGMIARRDLEGDTTEWGYNLALSLKPVAPWTISATYRSKVDLDLEGDATLLSGPSSYRGYAAVTVPVPAVLALATSYTFADTTVELAYDKTFWNAYDKLDFNYSQSLLANPFLMGFDAPVAKNWVNTEAYRIGITHRLNDQWTLMAGFAIDKNPVPDNTLGFELPDSDATLYSLGCRYRASDRLDLGFAYLYDHKESRTIPAAAGNSSGISGTFDDGGAHLVSIAARYQF